MKRFHFPLARVMDWRRTQMRIEEAKLQRAHAEVTRIELQIAELVSQRADSERALIASGSASGAELAVFESFKRFNAAESARLEQLAELSRKRAAAQMQAVTHAASGFRLVQKLHQREFAAWNAALQKDLDSQTEEAHMAKLAARPRGVDGPAPSDRVSWPEQVHDQHDDRNH